MLDKHREDVENWIYDATYHKDHLISLSTEIKRVFVNFKGTYNEIKNLRKKVVEMTLTVLDSKEKFKEIKDINNVLKDTILGIKENFEVNNSKNNDICNVLGTIKNSLKCYGISIVEMHTGINQYLLTLENYDLSIIKEYTVLTNVFKNFTSLMEEINRVKCVNDGKRDRENNKYRCIQEDIKSIKSLMDCIRNDSHVLTNSVQIKIREHHKLESESIEMRVRLDDLYSELPIIEGSVISTDEKIRSLVNDNMCMNTSIESIKHEIEELENIKDELLSSLNTSHMYEASLRANNDTLSKDIQSQLDNINNMILRVNELFLIRSKSLKLHELLVLELCSIQSLISESGKRVSNVISLSSDVNDITLKGKMLLDESNILKHEILELSSKGIQLQNDITRTRSNIDRFKMDNGDLKDKYNQKQDKYIETEQGIGVAAENLLESKRTLDLLKSEHLCEEDERNKNYEKKKLEYENIYGNRLKYRVIKLKDEINKEHDMLISKMRQELSKNKEKLNSVLQNGLDRLRHEHKTLLIIKNSELSHLKEEAALLGYIE